MGPSFDELRTGRDMGPALTIQKSSLCPIFFPWRLLGVLDGYPGNCS